jgi:hypothetical protein
MADNDRRSTEDIAMSRLFGTLGQPSLAEQLEEHRRQQAIARTMRDVVGRDARHNPNQTVPPETRTGPRGNGWLEERPLELPPGQKIIEDLCNYFLPPGSAGRREK